jgi:hypothetical protein
MGKAAVHIRVKGSARRLGGLCTATACTARLLLLSVLLLIRIHAAAQETVYVKDYGAIADDTLDDAAAIQAAFTFAKAHQVKCVAFAAGKYFLKAKAAPELNACFGLSHYNGLQVRGAMQNGAPATWLVKHNPQENNAVLPAHVRFDYCDQLTISGFVFDNTPQYATAGTITEKGPGYLKVAVYDGLPAVNGMACYTANLWDTATKNLKMVPSITFSEEVSKEKLYWQLTQQEHKNYMQLNSTRLAAMVQVGDGLSWHYGALTMFQLAINYCNNLVLNDLLTVNIAGWGIQTFACKNISSRKVVFRANGNQLAVGPRDAWKINSCNGLVAIDSMYVAGVRWDGQNVHGAFLHVKEVLTPTRIKVWKKYSSLAPFNNDSIGFWNGSSAVKKLAVRWENELQGDGGVYGIVETKDPVPAFVQAGTLITVDAWDIDEYRLQHATFKNIAGCAGVIKCSKAVLTGDSYDHIMYPAVVFGTEITTHNEATFPQDVVVRQCSFSNSGWIPRIQTKGLVGIGNSGTTAMAIGRILFDDCTFSNAATGIDAAGIQSLVITNSRFRQVSSPYHINKSNTGTIVFENNITMP